MTTPSAWACAPDSELAEILAGQRRAALANGVPDKAHRLRQLRALRKAVLRDASALIDAIDKDFGGRSETETVMSDIGPVLGAIDHAVRFLPRWMRPQRRSTPWIMRPGRAWIEYRPVGCVGIIGAWNFPFQLCLAPLVDAIAAGNRVMLKVPEMTPLLGRRLETLLSSVFAPEEVSVVFGGADVGAAFADLPFDHLLFTGSERVGRAVLRSAAETMTPVTLELGGKCPAVIYPDYDPASAVNWIAAGKWLNAGQVCLAPDYVLVPKDRLERFAADLFARMTQIVPTISENRDYTALVGAGRCDRLLSAVDEAVSRGAVLMRQGAAVHGTKLAPCIVMNPPLDCALMRDEIFGPVLPIIGYVDIHEAMSVIRGYPDPLAIYPFTNDRRAVTRLIDETPTGGVTWNGAILHGAIPDLPFGGVGRSGIGRYRGEAGFQRFSRSVSIYKPGFVSGFTAMSPPYGKLAAFVRRMTLR